MFVKNNNVHILHILAGEDEDGRPVGRSLRLMPGNNQIDDKDWDAACDNPNVQARIEAGQLEEITPKKAKNAGQVPASSAASTMPGAVDAAGTTLLSDLEDKQAIELVKETVDIDLLRAWLNQNVSQKVADVIESQIEKVQVQKEGK